MYIEKGKNTRKLNNRTTIQPKIACSYSFFSPSEGPMRPSGPNSLPHSHNPIDPSRTGTPVATDSQSRSSRCSWTRSRGVFSRSEFM